MDETDLIDSLHHPPCLEALRIIGDTVSDLEPTSLKSLICGGRSTYCDSGFINDVLGLCGINLVVLCANNHKIDLQWYQARKMQRITLEQPRDHIQHPFQDIKW